LRLHLNIFLFLFTLASMAQKDDVYTIVERMPQFPGGQDSLASYLKRNVIYPSRARELGAFGKVYLNFIVDTNGKITSTKIIKSAGDINLDEEAVRVIKGMPNWISGEDAGKKVKAAINIPINFSMEKPPGKPISLEEQAADEKHKEVMHYYDLGCAQKRQERYEHALAKFEICLKYEPNNQWALFDKALMHIKLGEKNKACETWDKMLKLNLRKEEVENVVKKYCN
jgi:periplasmic protein TonB